MEKKFISFDNLITDEERKLLASRKEDYSEALRLAISISIQSTSILGNINSIDENTRDPESIKAQLLELKIKIDETIHALPEKKKNVVEIKANTTPLNVSEISELEKRRLDNGGLAPRSGWKNISEIEVEPSKQNYFIEEARKMQRNGETITKSNLHYKLPVSISEFTEPFKYLEHMHDYNGSFLVSLMKSQIEINNIANTMQLSLEEESKLCEQGDYLILSIYDISGSSSQDEEKKFLIFLNFDKFNGVITYKNSMFMSNKPSKLSNRQMIEIEKFCKCKKINYHTIQ